MSRDDMAPLLWLLLFTILALAIIHTGQISKLNYDVGRLEVCCEVKR